jgi:hypothetical protein
MENTVYGTLASIMPFNKLPNDSMLYPKKHGCPLDIFYPLTDEISMLGMVTEINDQHHQNTIFQHTFQAVRRNNCQETKGGQVLYPFTCSKSFIIHWHLSSNTYKADNLKKLTNTQF